MSNLKKMLHEYDLEKPPYALNRETRCYDNAILVDGSSRQIIERLGAQSLFGVIDPMYKAQLNALRQYCNGKKDYLCRNGKECNNRNNGKCDRAHSKEECIDGVYEAVHNVDIVLFREIAAHKRSSRILMDLEAYHKEGKSAVQMTGGSKYGNSTWRRAQGKSFQ